MSFPIFKDVISALTRANRISVVFRYDMERGKYIAVCGDGSVITGYPGAPSLTIRHGRYHIFQVPFAQLQGAV